MDSGGWSYPAVFAVTTLLALVLTPLAVRLAVRGDILDHPSEIKAQPSPVPYLGGVAIVVSFAVVVLGAAAIGSNSANLDELAIVLGLAVVLAVVGLVDDLRGLGPWLRLFVEVVAGVIVWASPAGAEVFGNDVVDLVATVLWIVGVTNALNFLDNMDGLSAGTAAIAAFFVFVIAAVNDQVLVATLAIGLAGCALGFLRSNFHPARVYMGDAGSLFLGFMLAVLALKIDLLDAPRLVGLAVPVLILAIPIFDMVLVIVGRMSHGRSPMAGGRDHSSHRLVMVGLPVPVAVSLIYAGAISVGYMAVVVSRVDENTAAILLSWVFEIALLGGVLLSLVPAYESSRRRHLVLQEVRRHEPEPVIDDDDDFPPIVGGAAGI